jgi:hypothetical protein
MFSVKQVYSQTLVAMAPTVTISWVLYEVGSLDKEVVVVYERVFSEVWAEAEDAVEPLSM